MQDHAPSSLPKSQGIASCFIIVISQKLTKSTYIHCTKYVMPPKRRQEKIQADELATGKDDGLKLGLSHLGLSTEKIRDTNLPDEEPLWFKKAMVSFMQQVSEVIDKKLTTLDVQITDHHSSLETRLATLEGKDGLLASKVDLSLKKNSV